MNDTHMSISRAERLLVVLMLVACAALVVMVMIPTR